MTEYQELFNHIRNVVASTTGDKISDKSVALVICLFEKSKKELQENNLK